MQIWGTGRCSNIHPERSTQTKHSLAYQGILVVFLGNPMISKQVSATHKTGKNDYSIPGGLMGLPAFNFRSPDRVVFGSQISQEMGLCYLSSAALLVSSISLVAIMLTDSRLEIGDLFDKGHLAGPLILFKISLKLTIYSQHLSCALDFDQIFSFQIFSENYFYKSDITKIVRQFWVLQAQIG